MTSTLKSKLVAFTDDDLERVRKEMRRLEASPSSLPLDEMLFQIDYSDVRFLLYRLEAAEKLDEWVQHTNMCVRSFWCAGQPTKDGGYEEKFGDKWYQSRPIDRTPKCDCGLEDVLNAWRQAAGR